MKSPIHFYITYNPYLNDNEPGITQGHEFFNLLEKEISNNTNPYAHWGKIIGQDRDSRIEIEKFKNVLKSNNSIGHSTHLYISDFNHIWIGKVTEVNDSSPEDLKTLSFYDDKNVEIWFKLTDFGLLAFGADDTAKKLDELYIDNSFYDVKIKGLSPFTTGIYYPAFIQDRSEEAYFDQLDKGFLIEKYNSTISNSNKRRVLDILQMYFFPKNMYSKIPLAARNEIEAAELDIIEKRYNNIFRNTFSYIKALEICLNDLIINHLKRSGHGENFFVKPDSMPPKIFINNTAKELITLGVWHKNFSFSQILFFINLCIDKNNLCFKSAFKDKKNFLSFIQYDLPKILEKNYINEIRGILAHNDSTHISEGDAHAIRNIILGIGCQGIIQKCYQLFYDSEFENLTQIKNSYEKVKIKKKSA